MSFRPRLIRRTGSDGFCWCSPTVEEVIAAGRIYVHRQTIDSPHREARLT